MRGRKPKPPQLRVIDGNRGKRKPAAAGPDTGIAGSPEPPAGLSPAELAEWRAVTGRMAEIGTIGAENGAVVEAHVRALVWMRLAQAHVAEFGLIVLAPRTGVPMVNPHLAIAERAEAAAVRTAAELGLTPASRNRVGGNGGAKQPEDPAAKYIG